MADQPTSDLDALRADLAAANAERDRWHEEYRALFDETQAERHEHGQELAHLGQQVRAAKVERDHWYEQYCDLRAAAADSEDRQALSDAWFAQACRWRARALRGAAVEEAARVWAQVFTEAPVQEPWLSPWRALHAAVANLPASPGDHP